jgi:hypothetical protein
MDSPTSNEKLGQEQVITQYALSSEEGGQQMKENRWQHLRHYFTSREGWIGDYVRAFLLCPTLN